MMTMNGARLKQLQDELAQLGPRESIPRTDIARLIRYLESSVELGKLLLIGSLTLPELVKTNPPSLPPYLSTHKPSETINHKQFLFRPSMTVFQPKYFSEQLTQYVLWLETQLQHLYHPLHEKFIDMAKAPDTLSSDAGVSNWVYETLLKCREILRREFELNGGCLEYIHLEDDMLMEAQLRAIQKSTAAAATAAPTAAAAELIGSTAAAAVAEDILASTSAAVSAVELTRPAAATAAAAAAPLSAPMQPGSSDRRAYLIPTILLRAPEACTVTVPTVPGMLTTAEWRQQQQLLQDSNHQQQEPCLLGQQQQPQQQYVDVTLQQDRVIFIANVKTPKRLLNAQGQPHPDLAQEYSYGNPSVVAVVDETFTHMAVMGVRIACVTGHDVVYLLERPQDTPNALWVSAPITIEPNSTAAAAASSTDDSTISEAPITMLAYTWAQHKGLLQAQLPPAEPPSSNSWKSTAAAAAAAAVQQNGRQQQQQQQLVPMPMLTLSSLGISSNLQKLGAGATCVVYRGMFGNQAAALKVMRSKTMMLREVAIYNHLQDLQGNIIPKLLAWGMLHPVEAGSYVIAVSCIEGRPLCNARPISQAIAAAAKAALQRLHERNIVHGDIRNANILVAGKRDSSDSRSRGGGVDLCDPDSSTVVLIDLALSHLASTQQCSAELQQLERLLVAAAQPLQVNGISCWCCCRGGGTTAATGPMA